jgi:hypothetical protein
LSSKDQLKPNDLHDQIPFFCCIEKKNSYKKKKIETKTVNGERLQTRQMENEGGFSE